MKKHIFLALSVLLLTACNSQEEIRAEDEEIIESRDTNVENEGNSVEESFQSIIPSNWAIQLPTNFPVSQGNYLTATTSLDQQDTITINFYETKDRLPINDSHITVSGEFIGKLVITKYETSDLASSEIDKTVFEDGEAVNLGHGITGYQDAGAGSLFTSWNEGRWAIIARSRLENSEQNLAIAKETVEFLETHMLPIPKEYGYLHIDSEPNGSMAKWQKGNFVYELSDFSEGLLDWIITFE